MTTCITCQHWQPKQTDPGMRRLGFAQCMNRTKGHTYSATAPACDQHKAVTQEQATKRAEWINKGVGQ